MSERMSVHKPYIYGPDWQKVTQHMKSISGREIWKTSHSIQKPQPPATQGTAYVGMRGRTAHATVARNELGVLLPTPAMETPKAKFTRWKTLFANVREISIILNQNPNQKSQ